MIKKEQTLFLIKPDAVERKIVGEIIQRIERAGFRIVAAKIIKPSESLASKHYPEADKSWLETVGKRTTEDCESHAINVKELLGTDDPVEIGKLVQKWNTLHLMSGPLFALVLEGYNAIEKLRSIAGNTIPLKAAPGTIRGDYSLDSALTADIEKRTIYSIVHASGSVDEAKREIDLWFKPEELF